MLKNNSYENRLKVKLKPNGKEGLWCPVCETFPNNNFIERGMSYHSHTISDCMLRVAQAAAPLDNHLEER
jgi:hypothetical protein